MHCLAHEGSELLDTHEVSEAGDTADGKEVFSVDLSNDGLARHVEHQRTGS